MGKERNIDPGTFAVLTLLILLPLISISGCISDTEREDTFLCQLTLRVMSVTSRTVGPATVWDAHIVIDGKDPLDYLVPWSDIRLYVTEGDSKLVSNEPPDHYFYSPGESLGVWYEDMSGDPSTADLIDGFYLTTIDEDFEGALFEVFVRGQIAGSVELPDEFT